MSLRLQESAPCCNSFNEPGSYTLSFLSLFFFEIKQKGAGRKRGRRRLPLNPSPKRAKMVLCSFHRSHRQTCTRNRPLSETKLLDDFWGPHSSPGPFVLLLIFRNRKENHKKKIFPCTFSKTGIPHKGKRQDNSENQAKEG